MSDPVVWVKDGDCFDAIEFSRLAGVGESAARSRIDKLMKAGKVACLGRQGTYRHGAQGLVYRQVYMAMKGFDV